MSVWISKETVKNQKEKKSETHKSSQAGCVPNVNISPGLQSLWDFHLGHT